jgi:hypothetical protein
VSLSANAVPMRWASGPLEIARRNKVDGFNLQNKETLERSHEPASLDIPKNSPIDCRVLSWVAGLPEDPFQQQSAAPLIAAARQRNSAVVGSVENMADHQAAIAAARRAGLAAVAIQNFTDQTDFPVIPRGDRATMPWDAPGAVLAAIGNVWPGVSMPGNGPRRSHRCALGRFRRRVPTGSRERAGQHGRPQVESPLRRPTSRSTWFPESSQTDQVSRSNHLHLNEVIESAVEAAPSGADPGACRNVFG